MYDSGGWEVGEILMRVSGRCTKLKRKLTRYGRLVAVALVEEEVVVLEQVRRLHLWIDANC